MGNPADRRRSARVEVLGRIHGQAVTPDVPIVVREISLGGMSVETAQGFPVASTCDFLLMLGDGSAVDLLGKIVYSRATTEGGRSFYVSGIRFVDHDDRDPDNPVGGLLDKVS
jgi:hypothetical protein